MGWPCLCGIELKYYNPRKYIVFLVFLCLFQNSCIFQLSSRTGVEPLFVYYQNYEYLSTVKLNDYSGYYGNVKILRYLLPSDVLSAIWRLQLVATESCPATNVYFYLDYSAYPVISPNNRTFPQYFNHGRLTKTYVKRLVGGIYPFKQDVYLNISSPYAGYWFSAAFIDSNDQKVKPDLLRSNCSFYLTASINLWQINDTIVLYPNNSIDSADHSVFKIYKYMTADNDGPLTFEMSFNTNKATNKNGKNCTMNALLRQSAFPDMATFQNNNDYIICRSNASSQDPNCKLSIDYPLSNTWHYVAVTSDCEYSVRVVPLNECQSSSSPANSTSLNAIPELFKQLKPTSSNQHCSKTYSQPIETFRFIGPTYFSVKYYFNSNYNRSNALLVRNDRKPYFIEFLVDLANNGGTLNFLLVNNLVYDSNYEQETTTTTTTTTTSSKLNLTDSETFFSMFNRSERNLKFNIDPRMKDSSLADVRVILHACLLYNSMTLYSKCPEGYELVTQSYTNIFTSLQLNIAYPMMGKWYLAIWKECFDINTNESIPCPQAYVPYAVIQIVSDQCSNDYCGDYGTCYIINSQLNLVSACKCAGGYEGYGCTDGRNAIPARIYLASVLFLTLSNLVFMLPITLALYRGWYIESLIYFYNMFFSTFYHACDQDFFSFCIFNYDGLQLADFISSYSSFVITVLSMSSFVRSWKVFTFFFGLLACLSINLYDRFNYVAFIIFLCVAISVTVMTWVRICISQRRLHPNRKLLLKYYLPGFILALTGLLIYSFLQTKSNYWVLHSIWHMCMASSIVFFLPKREIPDFKVDSSGEGLKDVITTTSSLSDSSGSNTSTAQSPPSLLHANATEITLLEAIN